MKKQWLQVIGVLVFIFSTQAQAAPVPYVDFSINNGNDIYAGEAFSIDVYARDAVDLAGFGFNMNYDSSWALTPGGVSVWPGEVLWIDDPTSLYDDISAFSSADVAGNYLGLPFLGDPILSGDILLASLTFVASSVDDFAFRLLSDISIGEGLFDFGFQDFIEIDVAETITVNAARVPEPPVLLIMLMGMIGIVKTTKLCKV